MSHILDSAEIGQQIIISFGVFPHRLLMTIIVIIIIVIVIIVIIILIYGPNEHATIAWN